MTSSHNNRMHSDSKKRRSFVALLLLPVMQSVSVLQKESTEDIHGIP